MEFITIIVLVITLSVDIGSKTVEKEFHFTRPNLTLEQCEADAAELRKPNAVKPPYTFVSAHCKSV